MRVLIIEEDHQVTVGVGRDFGAAAITWKRDESTERLPEKVWGIINLLQSASTQPEVLPPLPVTQIEVLQPEPGEITLLTVSAEATASVIVRKVMPIVAQLFGEQITMRIFVDSEDQADYEDAVSAVMDE
jgi:hypothetical protein